MAGSIHNPTELLRARAQHAFKIEVERETPDTVLEALGCCYHSNLVRAVVPFPLGEHDVPSVFQVTGVTADGHQYFAKPWPAEGGDHFESFAESHLFAAISTCPHGDVSVPIWEPDVADALQVCHPLDVEASTLGPRVLDAWRRPAASNYAGLHGLCAS
jgi:uncharacterized protein YcgI (DUF1989 family)